MYFVDREKIEEILLYLEKLVDLFSKQTEWSTPIQKAALERIFQMMLEAVLDVGNTMIDGFIMRDPGSYEDIIEILMDEKVVSAETGNSLKKLISYREKKKKKIRIKKRKKAEREKKNKTKKQK